MAKAKALSNRQRKGLRKAVFKGARQGRLALAAVRADHEPVMSVRERVTEAEQARAAARLAVDAGTEAVVGQHGPVNLKAELAAEHGVELTRDRTLPGVPLRATSRDGLIALHRAGRLTDVQAKAGLAYRLAYESAAKGLGSAMGNLGMAGGGGKTATLSRSAMDLHRAYLLTRLNQMERAVSADLVDGRELHALRLIAGEGQTVRDVAGTSGHARAATADALGRALTIIAKVLRIAGQ